VVAVDVVDVVRRVCSVDVACADQATVAAVLADVAGVRRWLDGVEVACTQRLERLASCDPSISPEHVAATASRSSLKRAARIAARAATAAKVAEMGAALAAGDVSGEHVDAVTDGLSGLTEPPNVGRARRTVGARRVVVDTGRVPSSGQQDRASDPG
jgi:hypothetical protein